MKTKPLRYVQHRGTVVLSLSSMRQTRKLTQQAAAHRLGISVGMLQELEQGKRAPADWRSFQEFLEVAFSYDMPAPLHCPLCGATVKWSCPPETGAVGGAQCQQGVNVTYRTLSADGSCPWAGGRVVRLGDGSVRWAAGEPRALTWDQL